MSNEQTIESSQDTGTSYDSFEWAIVEVFGHRRHAGRAREEERFGAKMLRIDIPIDGDPDKGWETLFYGGASIFSYALTDMATVMKINRPYERPTRLTYADREESLDDAFGVGDE